MPIKEPKEVCVVPEGSEESEVDRKTAVVRNQIEDVRIIMKDALYKTLEREESIANLQQKTESLQTNAFQFDRRVTVLKKKLWWKNIKLHITICFVVLFFLVVLLIFFK